MPTEVLMPKLGESAVGEVTVGRWLKAEGDSVQQHEPLLEVTTDKVDSEIPAPASGVLLQILVKEGQAAGEGVCLALIGEVVGEAADSAGGEYAGYISPVVARMVAEHGIDLARVAGTGRDGRVTKKDVEAFLAQQGDAAASSPRTAGQNLLRNRARVPIPTDETVPTERPNHIPPRQPPPPFKGFQTQAERLLPVEPIPAGTPGNLVPLTAMRRAIAEHMVRSKLQTSPHVTTVFEFEMTAVLAHLQANKPAFAEQGVNLTLTAYLGAATAGALQAHPFLNAEWREEGIYLHHAVNLGLAVSVDDGLIVPVIRDAQDLSLMGMARAINDLAARARNKQLKPEEVRGGTFTISNHGVGGSLLATPIINQPQVAILGVGIVEKRVKVIDDMIAIRPCCYVTLTFDHRVADGAVGDAFMVTLKRLIEGWA
ncbi:MAG: 2-oxo acid dehydrogenase subunit E2 [Anaerolineae bacterium]|nr:2-oxo acid dehydrogenase subunit E2 [Anaerolineae bacterium]